jgi:hypothetical protein
MVIVEKLVEWKLAGETKVLGENLPQRNFVRHKSHMTRPGKPVTDRLSYLIQLKSPEYIYQRLKFFMIYPHFLLPINVRISTNFLFKFVYGFTHSNYVHISFFDYMKNKKLNLYILDFHVL